MPPIDKKCIDESGKVGGIANIVNIAMQNLHEKSEKSENSHFSQCIFIEWKRCIDYLSIMVR